MVKVFITTMLLLSQTSCSALPYKKDSNISNMQYIHGGSFLMGSPMSEKDREEDEKQHRVHVGDFWIGKTEVTYDQWQACVNDGGCQSNIYPESGGDYNTKSPEVRGKHPVSNVSWDDANEYTHWLSKNTGKNYRLPTEAEWEYAARAGTQTAYPWGDKIGEGLAVCRLCGKESGGGVSTAVVGVLKPYGGLYDMHGNVYEWTCSSYKKTYDNDTEKKCSSPKSRQLKVTKGGSFDSHNEHIRSAHRYYKKPNKISSYVGFRVVRAR